MKKELKGVKGAEDIQGTGLIADPIYHYIVMTDYIEGEKTERDVIDTPWVQRLRHIPSLLRVYPINFKWSLLFLLLNIAGKRTVKYIDTSLDWVDNNEKWNFQKIPPDDKVLKGSNVFSSDKSHPPFQSLKDGSEYKNDELHLNKENKIL